MGREIRRVPPNWQHPTDDSGAYKPLHDETYKSAADDWKARLAAWENGQRPSCFDPDKYAHYEFWEWEDNPPKRDYYLPEFDAEPAWFQAYETVSEGTPVSPPFETESELVNYLAEHGDFWCQKRPGERPPSRKAAEAFVSGGWVPSMVLSVGDGQSTMATGIESASAISSPDD